jgi:hypothetical protein
MSYKFVIGGGWTVSAYDTRDLYKYGHVYGINDASLWTNVHTALTMDRLWFEHRWPHLKIKRIDDIWAREGCDKNVKNHTARIFNHKNTPILSTEEGFLCGSNSGTCGVNLAFQRMTEGDTLFLLGFDMQKGPDGDPYWYPPYEWAKPEGATKDGHYREWAREFESIYSQFKAKHMNVFNVSHRTAIKAFPIIRFDQMMNMLERESD